MGAFKDATSAYYYKGNWTITAIRNELIMQGMRKADAEREIANQLGVGKRTVERYLQQETEGSSKQTRGKKSLPKKQAQINALGAKILKPKSAQGEGVTVNVNGKVKVRSSKKKKQDDERDRDFNWAIDDEEWARLVQLAQEEGEGAAEQYFFEDLYGVPGMTLEAGTITAIF